MPAPIRIANGAGFLGDQLEAPRKLVESASVDVLTLEYLAELTLSILAAAKGRDRAAGYAKDWLVVLRSLLPAIQQQPNLRIITNAGGVNPLACAKASAEILAEAGLGDLKLGVVDGDDLSNRMGELQKQGESFAHFDDGQPFDATAELVCANAYLGAAPIVESLAAGARIVITGRVADASLTVAPCVNHFGWDWNDANKLAGATVAGHLIECGAQATGGYSTDWRQFDLSDVGYPIAEVTADGDCSITKPANSGGAVNRQTIVEQLVYEIGDPTAYYTPDVVADFSSVTVEETTANTVSVRGALGSPAPATYKVSLAQKAGFTAQATLVLFGDHLREKAGVCAEMIFDRVAAAGFVLDQTHWELLGTGDAVPQSIEHSVDATISREGVLRMAVRATDRRAVERFSAEVAPLITSGPSGLAGYAQPRAAARPAFAYWPTIVDKGHIEPRVQTATVKEWNS